MTKTPNTLTCPFIPSISKEEFDALPNNKKIVKICQDVIDRVRAKNIVARNRLFYVRPWDEEKDDVIVSDQTFINSHECKVCAKGGIALAWIGNFNKYNLNNFGEQLDSTGGYPPELIEIFGKYLLDSIEVAFEGKIYHTWQDFIENSFNIIKQFEGIYDADEKLITIMQNIVDNDGQLVVS